MLEEVCERCGQGGHTKSNCWYLLALNQKIKGRSAVIKKAYRGVRTRMRCIENKKQGLITKDFNEAWKTALGNKVSDAKVRQRHPDIET